LQAPGTGPRSHPLETRRTVRIVNRAGLHARPCQMVVATAQPFESDLRVACGGQEVNGRSILELMTLQAGPDACLEFTARGPDADSLVESLVALVERGFEESS